MHEFLDTEKVWINNIKLQYKKEDITLDEVKNTAYFYLELEFKLAPSKGKHDNPEHYLTKFREDFYKIHGRTGPVVKTSQMTSMWTDGLGYIHPKEDTPNTWCFSEYFTTSPITLTVLEELTRMQFDTSYAPRSIPIHYFFMLLEILSINWD